MADRPEVRLLAWSKAPEYTESDAVLDVPFAAAPADGLSLEWPEAELIEGAGMSVARLALKRVDVYPPSGQVADRKRFTSEVISPPPAGWWQHAATSDAEREVAAGVIDAEYDIPPGLTTRSDYRVRLTVRDSRGRTTEVVTEPFTIHRRLEPSTTSPTHRSGSAATRDSNTKHVVTVAATTHAPATAGAMVPPRIRLAERWPNRALGHGGVAGSDLDVFFQAIPAPGAALDWPAAELYGPPDQPPRSLALRGVTRDWNTNDVRRFEVAEPESTPRSRLAHLQSSSYRTQDPAPADWWHGTTRAEFRLPDDLPTRSDYRLRLLVRDDRGQTGQVESEPFTVRTPADAQIRSARRGQKSKRAEQLEKWLKGAGIWFVIATLWIIANGNRSGVELALVIWWLSVISGVGLLVAYVAALNRAE